MPTPRTLRFLLATGLCSLALAIFAAVQLSRAEASTFHGTEYPDAPPAPAFELIDQDGDLASLADYAGRPVLLFFGFTRCADVCPLTLTRIRNVLESAELTADEVSVLLVSVDPEYDTPERLDAYLAPFGPGFIGLTGEPATVERVLADYGVFARPAENHDGHTTLAHTTLLFGIDRTGRLRVLIHPEEPHDIVESDVRALVRMGD